MNEPPRHIGVLGGSFDPVHKGHVALAEHIAQTMQLDYVLMMLSRKNPLKTRVTTTTDAQRLDMLKLACNGHPLLRPCSYELTLPAPSYTIHTLTGLQQLMPQTRISLIIGSDNWEIFYKWKDYQTLIKQFWPIIYPRDGFDCTADRLPPTVSLTSSPCIDISSTEIRRRIAGDQSFSDLVATDVKQYIINNHLYS